MSMDEYYPVDHSTELSLSNNWFNQWVISENAIEVYSGKNMVKGPGVLSCRFCETDLAHWTHEFQDVHL